jgi:hypothetical protein
MAKVRLQGLKRFFEGFISELNGTWKEREEKE